MIWGEICTEVLHELDKKIYNKKIYKEKTRKGKLDGGSKRLSKDSDNRIWRYHI